MMRWVKRGIGAIIALYLLVIAVVFFSQRSMLYFPPAEYYNPEQSRINMTEIRLDSSAFAWWSPPAEDKPVIMVFHGNGSAIYSNTPIFETLMDQGYGVMSVGYPGYPGNSDDQATQPAISKDSQDLYNWLIEQGITKDEIVFYGTSLGSGIAAQLAQDHPPALLILDAPFNSTLDMAKRQLPWLPVGLLMKDTYRSDLAMAELDMPLIWIHGTKDNIVPLSQGQKLFDGYDGPKTAHILKGSRHTNNWQNGGRDITLEALAKL